MSLAFTLLLVSIAASPVLAIFDGLAAQSIVAILEVAALASVGLSVRAADVNFAARVTRYLSLVAAIPAIWMIIQLLPLPFGSHSIWINASEALDQRSWGHISIDLGSTISALAVYLANVGLIVVSLFVARDRHRAELILFTLTGITSLAAIILLISKAALGENVPASANDVLGAVSSLGILLALTLAARGTEQNRRAERSAHFQSAFVMSALALLVGIGGLASSSTLNVILATLFAALVFGSLQVIRQAGLPNWAAGIVVATLIIAAAMIAVWRYDPTRMLSPLLQFASSATSDALSMTQRMLSDATWEGTGAGTYAELAPIYQELGNSATKPPTTAAAVAIELGRPMTLFTLAAALAVIAVLYRGALIRGRDSFYPAGAAVFAISFLSQAFCDASLLNSTVTVIGDAMIGLGLAQCLSSGDNF